MGNQEVVACPCCDSAASRVFEEEAPGLAYALETRVSVLLGCPNCFHVFRPPESDQEVQRYYREAPGYSTPRAGLRETVGWLAGHMKQNLGRVLEIGAKDEALKYELEARCFLLESYKASGPDTDGLFFPDNLKTLQSERFDLAIALHILEHVSDPRAFLHALACTGARHIFIEVPDIGLVKRDFSDPHRTLTKVHLHFFSEASLFELGRSAGLRVVHIGRSSSYATLPVLRVIYSEPVHNHACRRIQNAVESLAREEHAALEVLRKKSPSDVALYGASEGLVRLWARDKPLVESFPLFDLHKYGQSLGSRDIWKAESIQSYAFSEVLVTAPDLCTFTDCATYLKETFGIEAKPLFKHLSLWIQNPSEEDQPSSSAAPPA